MFWGNSSHSSVIFKMPKRVIRVIMGNRSFFCSLKWVPCSLIGLLPRDCTPVFIQHSHDWIYSFSGKQQVNLKCHQNATWITLTWSLQGNGILHNFSACHVRGQNFQLYPATEGHSVSTVEYRDDIRVLHIEPVTYQEVQIIRGYSPPDVWKSEGIAASELFKHWDLDATLVVHATERKHDDRCHSYWYITIPTLAAILLTIMICNGYSFLFRNLLHRIRCTTQPVVNSTPGNKSLRPPDISPEEQPSTSQLHPNGSGRKSEFVTYSVQTVAWSRHFQSIEQPRRKWEWTTSSSSYPLGQWRNKWNPQMLDRKCAVLLYVSVNSLFHEILGRIVVIRVLTFSSEFWVEALLLSKNV